MKKKVGMAIALVIATLVIIVILLVYGLNNNSMDSVICVYDEGAKESAIYINSKFIDKVEGKAALHNNMDNSTYFISTDVAVYIMENASITKIDNGLTLETFANNSNEAILKDKNDVLYLYTEKKLNKLTEEKTSIAVLSGDGNCFAYSTEDAAYLGRSKDDIQKYDGVIISHISEDGNIVYMSKHVSKDEFELYVSVDGKEPELIEKKATSIIGLNANGTEMMFTNVNGTSILIGGKETKQITSELVVDIYYYDDEKSWCGDFWSVDTLKGSICEVLDSDGKTYSICKVLEDYKAETIVSKCAAVIGIDSSMDRVFYRDNNGDLYRVDTKIGAKSELLAEDVELVRVSPDGNDVYFTRLASENITVLYHVEKGLKEKELAYMYDFFDIIVYDECCYIEAEEIHYVKNDKVEKLENVENLEKFFIDYIAQKAYGYDKNNVYEIKGKDKVKLDGEYESIIAHDYVY